MRVRIATYNLWAADTNRDRRIEAAVEELVRLDADVVALQEVHARVSDGIPTDAATYIQREGSYPQAIFRPYSDDPGEGLAFLSRYPLHDASTGSEQGFRMLGDRGLRVHVHVEGVVLAFTNVHLAHDGMILREAQAVDAIAWVDSGAGSSHYEILLGDFNSAPDSSVYRYLAGQQSLNGTSTVPWHDLAFHHARRHGTEPAPTLDFWNNPRWRDNPRFEAPARFDWILVKDSFEDGLPWPRLLDAGVFGVDPVPPSMLVPSDHYGVYADLEFPVP